MKLSNSHIVFLLNLILLYSLFSCNKQEETEPEFQTDYSIEGEDILYKGEQVHLKGVNALHSFGLEELELMDSWNIEIVREFIGNLREQPITGGAIQGSDGKWLHPLEQIVEKNRSHGKVTILCPFGWVNQQGDLKLFTGLNPSDQDFYEDYKTKMRSIADHFAGQHDVWIEVWNEPYHWNNENGYTHQKWLDDMREMILNLRSVNGFNSIIVIPGNEQGQGESALLEKGQELISKQQNILFDIHAYEKWLVNNSETEIIDRLNGIKTLELAFIVGEVGVINVSELMNPLAFLNATQQSGVSTLAWLWKRESGDQNALLTEDDIPNDNNNNRWGSTFKEYLNR